MVKHLKEVKRIFRYLRQSYNKGLWYSKDSRFELIAYSDADHVEYKDDCKSTSGGLQFLGGKLVSWSSKKQDCTAMSTAEAEYVSLSACCAQVIWMRTQLLDYGYKYNRILMYCDSKSTVELYFVGTEYQLADLFTKALPKERIKYLVHRIVIIMAHQQLVADVHPDELCPPNKQYDLMDANKKIDMEHVQCPPESKILTNIIKNHPLRFSIAASSVPWIYMEQFWHTLKEDALSVRNKMQKAFPLPVIKFPLAEEVPTVIEFGDSYVVPANTTDTTSSDKLGRTLTLTAKDMQRKKNDVKTRTTLLLSLLDEHQLRFSKYKTAKELWAAILKTFGGNEATKKTKKNLLKQQYGNFKVEGSETLEQTFNRLQVIIGQLQFMDVEIEKDDLNQKFLISLSPEWLMHTIVWRNRSDLDTMSLDDLYNHLKEDGNTASVPTTSTNVPTISASIANISQDTACAYIVSQSSGSQIKFEDINQIDKDDMEEMDIKWNMALLSMRADNGNEEVNTASISTTSANIGAASISQDTACAYIASQSNGSQIKFKDINQIDEDDMEEMDIKWNMALLSMRADRFWKKTGKKITIQGTDVTGFDKLKENLNNGSSEYNNIFNMSIMLCG
nr:copia protein [Tanacetum cinerariifolium]